MTTEESTEAPLRRSKKPIFLALAGVVAIIAIVTIVLVLAGGDKTRDGTGRQQITSVSSPTNVTNSGGDGAGGPVR